MSDTPLVTFSSRRKWSIGLNLAVTFFALVAILAMINYVSAQHYLRFSWSPKSQVELSELTREALTQVTNQVHVTIFFDKEDPLYDSVSDLLKEYEYLNRGIEVRRVDYKRDPGGAQSVKSQYDLNPLIDKDVVIFESSDRLRVISQKELSELDIQPLLSGQSKDIKRTHFKGEMLFTSAILNVTSQRQLKAYFLTGHREHSPENTDAETGFSRFAGLLKDSNVEWSMLSLIGTNQVPDDCSLLIIAGPQNPLDSSELDQVDQYLNRGGRLFVLLNFYGINRNAGLRYVLSKWGVSAQDNVVKDPGNTSNGQDIFIGNFGPHPISKPLVQTPLHVIYPRSIRASSDLASQVNAPKVTELIYTGPGGRIYDEVKDGVVVEASARPAATNVCLAVAVEKGKIRDVSADRGTTRMVVTGDSFFLNNQMIYSFANRDFASLSINWLLDQSEMLGGLGPRPVQEYKLIVTKTQMRGLWWTMLLVLPGSVLLVGLVVWTRRRR